MTDEYISLGSTCAVANYLSFIKKRQISYPFDWCKINIKQLNNCLENDFKDFINLEIIKYSNYHNSLENINNKTSTNGSYILKNSIGITFAHEITQKYKLPEFKEKLTYRITRFNNLNKPHFIRYEEHKYKKYYETELHKLIKILDNKYDSYNLALLLPVSYNINIDKVMELFKNENIDSLDNIRQKIKIVTYDNKNYNGWENLEAFKSLTHIIKE